MLDPAAIAALIALLDSAGRLGASALLVGAIYGLLSRRVRTAGETIDRDALWADRLAEQRRVDSERNGELREDRDYWRSHAISLSEKFGRQTDVLEAIVDHKLPSADS